MAAVVLVGISFLSIMSPSDVPGFFYAEAAVRHILTVQKEQSIEGALAEIGVHHGKSFATMLDASAPGVPVVAIDVFEDQHLNYDRSGNTTQDIFLSTLRNIFTAIAADEGDRSCSSCGGTGQSGTRRAVGREIERRPRCARERVHLAFAKGQWSCP